MKAKRTIFLWLTGLVLLGVLWGCGTSPTPSVGQHSPQASLVAFEGTVRYISLEGGFYGIETDTGVRLNPVNLPEGLQRNGLGVRGKYVKAGDVAGIQMWGTPVEVYGVRPYFPNPDWN